MKENKSYRIISWLLILLAIVALIINAYKTYKQINIYFNSYLKYEKSEIAEIIDVDTKVVYGRSGGHRRAKGTETFYKIKLEETGKTMKIIARYNGNFFEGGKVYLSYYNLYDKNSNEYCGESYDMTPLNRFDKSFYELGDNFYFFYDSNYPNKIVEFKIDFPNTRYDKEEIGMWSYPSDVEKPKRYQTNFLLTKEVDATMRSIIEVQGENIDKTETLFGIVYDFNNNGKHYSVLNYGDEIKDSLVLITEETDSYHIIDYIINKK